MENRGNKSCRADNLHSKLLIADAHCDTILCLARGKRKLSDMSDTGHVDLPRLREGGVRLQFFAAFIESEFKPYNSLTRVLQLIDVFYREIDYCGEEVKTGLEMAQIKKDLDNGKLVALLGIEGGEAINGDLSVLRCLYRLGVRFLGLTWNQRNQIADGVGERITGGGLTSFGRQLIKEMNRLQMLIDLAHISEKGFWDVLEISQAPVIVSHANCFKLCNHPRNLTDDQIRGLADKGGVLGLSFVPDFINGADASLDDFLAHIDHAAELVGTEHIALGSDFDGIEKTPRGMEDCRCFPKITYELLKRGYTEQDIRNIMGENVLRLLENVLK